MNAHFIRITYLSTLAAGAAALALGLGSGCSSAEEPTGPDGEAPAGERGEAIRNGFAIVPWAPGSTDQFAKAVVNINGCTGTVTHPSWVLSAKHCGYQVGNNVVSIRPSGNVVRTVDAVVNNLDPDRDTVMLHVSAPFTDVPPVTIYPFSTASVAGKKVTCYGYGAVANGGACSSTSQCQTGEYCHTVWGTCFTPTTDLRWAMYDGTAENADLFSTPENAFGQTNLPGDSGGPCLVGGLLAGVNSFGNLHQSWSASVAASYDFIRSPSRAMYTTGDFNNDGKDDVIITNASGSYWYFSTGTGTWNQAHTRTDLPLGSVMYTPADFNGDGKTDLIVTTAGGSYWYFSNGDGSWAQPHVRTDLPLHSVAFTPGDFNGDGKDDVIISNTSGSYWYYSNGNGSWNTAYTRLDLPSNLTSFTPGDFNGDGKDDVIITNASGSYWYYSTGLGTWNQAYSRTDLPTESVRFAVADFNNDGKDDAIISTPAGSYWYYSTGTGTWNQAYTRLDLPLGSADFTTGDFNNDGKDDVIITNASGSYWYYSTGTGTWNQAYTRLDLTRYATHYKAGDFNGDGKDDMIITNESGSYWYYSTGTGTWNQAYTRTDLPMLRRHRFAPAPLASPRKVGYFVPLAPTSLGPERRSAPACSASSEETAAATSPARPAAPGQRPGSIRRRPALELGRCVNAPSGRRGRRAAPRTGPRIESEGASTRAPRVHKRRRGRRSRRRFLRCSLPRQSIRWQRSGGS